MYDELEKMCKEVVVAYFNILSSHSLGGTGENHESPRSE
jgi:hypothetical protein